MKINTFAALSLLLLSTSAQAQSSASSASFPQTERSAAPAARTTPAAPAATPEAPASPPVGFEETGSRPNWQTPMTKYELGQPDPALEELRALALHCGAPEDGRCSRDDIATLYACVGIVLAGGKQNHMGGVQAFRKALNLQPSLGLLEQYRTVPVIAAYEEAKTGRPAADALTSQPSGVTNEAAGQAQGAPEAENPQATEAEKDRMFLLIGAGGKFGRDGSGSTSVLAAQSSVSGTFLALPDPTSSFALGGRVRAGSHTAERYTEPYVGGSFVVGNVIGPRIDDQFGFLLAGTGIEYSPSFGYWSAALQVHAGRSFGGFMLAGGIDFTIGTGFGAGDTAALLGVELGWGGGI